MLIDLTCPVEIFRTAMPTGDTQVLSLTMFNLSDRVIVSAEVTARLLSASGLEKEKMVFRGRALNGRPHSTFVMNVPMGFSAGAHSADVTVEKIWFADNDTWQRKDGEETEYTPNALPSSPALTRLKYVAGEFAVGYPMQEDGLWVCVCGRPNPDRATVCARCRQDKESVFARFSRETVEKQVSLREKQLDLSSRSAREDTARLQRIREEEYNTDRARRGRRIRLGCFLVLFCVLMAGIVQWAIPSLRLGAAAKDMEQGNYETALETLREISFFHGADEKIAECEWQLAAASAKTSEDIEELAAASQLLRENTDREGSSALADLADLKRAKALYALGDRDGALAAVEAVDPENAERVSLERDCRFDTANEQLEAGEYAAAREAFLSLGDYPGAAELATECIYRPAVSLAECGEYENAIRELSRIPEYRDSRQLTLECHYRIAADLEAVGDLAGAATEFLLAGDYEDAPDKNREMVYLQAEAAMRKGDLESAQAMYASIPGYEDADDKSHACLYTLANIAMADMEYTLAYKMLRDVPEGYLNADSLRTQAAYEAGKIARAGGDLETARELLEAAGKYKNAQRLLNQVNTEIRKAEEAAAAAAAAEEAAEEAARAEAEAGTAEETAVPEATEAPEAEQPESTATPAPTPTPAPTTAPEATPAPAKETGTPKPSSQDDEYLVKDGD